MGALPKLGRRILLTAVGWAIGGFLIAWILLAVESLTGSATIGVPIDQFGFLTVIVGSAVFVILSAVLLGSGSRTAVSRRVMAVVGALAMLAGLFVVETLLGGGLAVLGGVPNAVLLALAVGAVLGWCSLAIGGVRE